MDYPITVVGSFDGPRYDSLATGVVLTLARDPSNKADPNAVRALWPDGTHAGYVANGEDTIVRGTMSATRLLRLMDPARVAATTVMLHAACPNNSRGGAQRRFVGHCFFVPRRSPGSESVPHTVVLTVAGTQARNNHKNQMLSSLADRKEENGIPLTLRMVNLGDRPRYLFFEEGESTVSCGELEPEKMKEDASEVAAWFADNPEGALSAVTTGTPFQVSASESPRAPKLCHVKAEITLQNEGGGSRWDEAIDRCISRGCGQLPELEARVAVMEENRVSASVIRKVLDAMRPRDSEVPPKPVRPYHSATQNLGDSLAFSLAHLPLRLMGEKGSGKNTLAETICWILNQPMLRVQGSVELDKMDLLGAPQLTSGNTTFRLSQVMDALKEGKTVVIDEANLIRPDVLGLLHSATDEARSVLVPGYGLVKLAPTAQIIYTMNEGYVGTSDMNEATVDRTVTFELTQETDLKEILKGFPAGKVEICQKISDDIHKGVREGTLPPDAVTIRGYLDALRVPDVDLSRALKVCVANKAADRTVREAILAIISLYC